MGERKSDEPASAPEPAAAPSRDVVFVYGKDEESGDLGVVRQREDRVELGRLSQAREGQPIHGELLRLAQRPEDARLFDVEVLHDARPSAPARSGPPQVATEAYRSSWERTFGAARRGEGSGLEN